MMIIIREATIDDVEKIVEIHKSDVKKWYKIENNGLVEANYDELSIDERWLHGGQWMSKETYLHHFRNFTSWGGKILVAVLNGEVVGEIEFIDVEEPEPYGEHVSVYVLMIHQRVRGKGVGKELMKAVEKCAKEKGIKKILVNSEERSLGFYRKIGYGIFEAYTSIEIKINTENIGDIGSLHYEPLTGIDETAVYARRLIVGRFLDTKSTLYNIKIKFPLTELSLKFFYFKLLDNHCTHFIVFRKSNMINHSLYSWLDTKYGDWETMSNVIKSALSIGEKIGLDKVLTCVPSRSLDRLRKNGVKFKEIEKIPIFVKYL